MDVLREIELQVRARGFASRSDAVAAGVADSTFSELARRLDLGPTYTGLWAPKESPLALVSAAKAALHVVGEPSLITGATGLALLGMKEASSAATEVAVPLRRSPVRRDGICVHHTSTYDDIRYQHANDIAVARAERCFADLAAHATYKELAMLIAYADRDRRVTLASLEKELGKRKRFAGRTVLRVVLRDLREEVAHSSYERLGRRLLNQAGHAPHRRPLTVLDGQRLVAEIDIPFAPIRYGVEIDGPHHLLAYAAAADRIRDRQLTSLGWQIDRFFWFELDERPKWFVSEVARRIAARSSSSTS